MGPLWNPLFFLQMWDFLCQFASFEAFQRIPAPVRCWPLLTNRFTRRALPVLASNLPQPPHNPHSQQQQQQGSVTPVGWGLGREVDPGGMGLPAGSGPPRTRFVPGAGGAPGRPRAPRCWHGPGGQAAACRERSALPACSRGDPVIQPERWERPAELCQTRAPPTLPWGGNGGALGVIPVPTTGPVGPISSGGRCGVVTPIGPWA